MDKKKLRVSRLRAIVDADGGPAEFARNRSQEDQDKPIDPTYVSQLLNEHRSFGEKAAENMARRAGLPFDYFDKEDSSNTIDRTDAPQKSKKKSNLLKASSGISPEAKSVIDRLCLMEASGSSSPQLIAAIESILDLVAPNASPDGYSGLQDLKPE